MRITIVAVVLWAMAAGPLAGCGKSTTSPNATTTTTTTTATATAKASTAAALTKADLDALLLTLADMPAGFSLDPWTGSVHCVQTAV